MNAAIQKDQEEGEEEEDRVVSETKEGPSSSTKSSDIRPESGAAVQTSFCTTQGGTNYDDDDHGGSARSAETGKDSNRNNNEEEGEDEDTTAAVIAGTAGGLNKSIVWSTTSFRSSVSGSLQSGPATDHGLLQEEPDLEGSATRTKFHQKRTVHSRPVRYALIDANGVISGGNNNNNNQRDAFFRRGGAKPGRRRTNDKTTKNNNNNSPKEKDSTAPTPRRFFYRGAILDTTSSTNGPTPQATSPSSASPTTSTAAEGKPTSSSPVVPLEIKTDANTAADTWKIMSESFHQSTQAKSSLPNNHNPNDNDDKAPVLDTIRTGRRHDQEQQVAEEFLSSQANIELLQHDLAQAEELFFRDYCTGNNDHDPNETATTTTTDLAAHVVPLLPPTPEDTTDETTEYQKIQLFHPSHYDNVEHVWDRKPFCVQRMWTFFGSLDPNRLEKVVQQTRRKIMTATATALSPIHHNTNNNHKTMPLSTMEGKCWDPEGLVLADIGRLLGSKLYVSIQNPEWLLSSSQHQPQQQSEPGAGVESSPTPTTTATSPSSVTSSGSSSTPTISPSSSSSFHVEYLSGTWLSKVYTLSSSTHESRGGEGSSSSSSSYHEFQSCVQDAMDYVQRHYSVPIHNHYHKKGHHHHGPAAQAQAPNWLVYYPSALEEESLPGGGLGNGAVEVKEQPLSAQPPFSAGAEASNTTSPSSSNNKDTSESTSVQEEEEEEEEEENEQNDKDNKNDKDKFSGGPNDNDDDKNMTQQPEPDHQQTAWVPSSVVVFFIKVSEEE